MGEHSCSANSHCTVEPWPLLAIDRAIFIHRTLDEYWADDSPEQRGTELIVNERAKLKT